MQTFGTLLLLRVNLTTTTKHYTTKNTERDRDGKKRARCEFIIARLGIKGVKKIFKPRNEGPNAPE